MSCARRPSRFPRCCRSPAEDHAGWYTYEGDQLGQGKENARTFLKEHPEIALDIERKVREAVGLAVERLLGLEVRSVTVLVDGVGS